MDFQFFHAMLALAVVVLPLALIWALMAWGDRSRLRKRRDR